MPHVSVVITSFNAEGLIAETIDSILAQDYRDFEVVVVDGGSTDRTPAIVSRYGGRVRLLLGERLTKAEGRNAGIRAATGDLIALVDADDCWFTHKLTRQVEYFDGSPGCQWLYSDCVVVDERRRGVATRWSQRNVLYAGDIFKPLLFDCFVPSPTPVIRKSVFEKVGLYDESLKRHEPEDWDMWLRIAARYPAGLIHEPLARLRVHSGSLTSREDPWLAAEGALAVVERAFQRNPGLTEQLHDKVAAHWRVCFGKGLVAAGRTAEGRNLIEQALRYSPWDAEMYILWMSTWIRPAVLRAVVRVARAGGFRTCR